MKYLKLIKLEYIKRFLGFPFVAILCLISVLILYFVYLTNFVRFGGEFITYTHSNQRKTIKDIYNKLEENGMEKLSKQTFNSPQL
jgi:hypothetical protein